MTGQCLAGSAAASGLSYSCWSGRALLVGDERRPQLQHNTPGSANDTQLLSFLALPGRGMVMSSHSMVCMNEAAEDAADTTQSMSGNLQTGPLGVCS